MAGKMGQENTENMLRSGLVSVLTQKMPRLGADDPRFDSNGGVEHAVAALLDRMGTALAGGGRIEVRGFGSFSLHQRPPRKGRNPKSGQPVMIPATAAIHFKPGKEMKGLVNQLPGLPAPLMLEVEGIMLPVKYRLLSGGDDHRWHGKGRKPA